MLFLNTLILFFVMIVSVKVTAYFLFDFFFGSKLNIRYPRLIKDIVTIILYIVGILLIVKYQLHIELTVFLASSAILTVVVGFALQDILGDLFSGIAINLDESLGIGDWIHTGNFEGKIEQFLWRSIKIRTTDNTLVLIPNRIASKQEVHRLGHKDEPFALRLKIGISYDNSPDTVISSIIEVLDAIPIVLKDPAPIVMVNEFQDSSILYDVKFWMTDYSQKDPIKSEIRRKAWYTFKRNNIRIPFPVRDVYIRKAPQTEDIRHELTREQWIAVLKKNETFNTFSQEQLESLVRGIEIIYYGKGEFLIKEGEVGAYFYHILEGEAEVIKNNKVIAHLRDDDYVGEMSLFTGDKTTADVRVSKESKILRLSSGKFREAVKMNEHMARKLSEVIALRKNQLQEFKEKEDLLQNSHIKKESESIFLRIKKYFSI